MSQEPAVAKSSTATSSDRSWVSRPSWSAAVWSIVLPPRRSAPSVRFGCTPLSQTALARAWSPEPSPTSASAGREARPETTTRRSLNGSIAFSVGVNSKSRPTASGVHFPRMAPFGMYTKPRRRTGVASVLARAVAAGIIASSKGRATVAPMPRRKVRRGINFFVMIIAISS